MVVELETALTVITEEVEASIGTIVVELDVEIAGMTRKLTLKKYRIRIRKHRQNLPVVVVEERVSRQNTGGRKERKLPRQWAIWREMTTSYR